MKARNERSGSTRRLGLAVLVLGVCAAAMLWLPLPAAGAVLATGGTVTNYTDAGGTNWTVRIFKTVGTSNLNVTAGGNVDVLVVAGGGGGGKAGTSANACGGGGGAGGLLYSSSYSLSDGEYTVFVGNRGAGSTTSTSQGENGQDSYIQLSGSDVFRAIGGGGGGSKDSRPGADGGSGGGAGGTYNLGLADGGAGTAGSPKQGSDGGDTTNGRGGGGGGGANAEGSPNAGASGGGGGAGRTISITGSEVPYARGGDGGTYTATGGGNGADATPNTGGGGGGGLNSSGNGGNGGSGIVMVRYATARVPVTESDGATGVTEGGAGDTYGVRLNAAPANSVTVTCTFDDSQLDVSPTELVFTTSNYADPQTVTVAAVDDELLEGPHQSIITHTATSADAAYDGIAVSNVTVTITDNEGSGEIALSASAYAVGEAGGSITIHAVRSGSTSGAVDVDYSTADGTAVDGTHYTATNGALHWADGSGGTQSFVVAILDNGQTDIPDPVFNVAISNATTGAIVAPSNATVTIADNDPRGTVSFSSASYAVAEGAGAVTVTVLRQNGSNEAASVAFATADGTALDGADYTATNGVLNWADDEGGAREIEIVILDDAVFRGARAFSLALSSPTAVSLVSPSNATVTITEDDPFAMRDSFKTGGTPAAGEYSVGGLLNQAPTIAGTTGAWGTDSKSTGVDATGLTNALVNALGGMVKHVRNGGGYQSIARSLSATFGAGSASKTLWFASLHKVTGFTNTGNMSHWQYDLGGGAIRWGIYSQSVHAFGTDIAPATAGQTYLVIAKLEKNVSGATDRWSVWVDPENANAEAWLRTPAATGTSDFWKDASAISSIAIEIQGDGNNAEQGLVDELQIAERFDGLDFVYTHPRGTLFIMR